MGYWRNERGQALVEFALILPLFLLLLIGITEFGRIFHAQLVIDQAARNAVRYGSITRSDSVMLQVIAEQTSSLQQERLSVHIEPEESQRRSGETITLTIDYTVPLITPFLSNWIPNPFPLSTTMSMRVE